MINEGGLFEHHKKKKKKRDAAELYTEESSQYNEIKLKHHKEKKKPELLAESYVDFDKYEPKQLKKKKKEKPEVPDLSQQFESDKITDQNLPHSETCTLYTEDKFDFDQKHKHGKKRKKEKEGNLNEKETFAIVDESEVPPQKQKKSKIHSHIGEADISNEVDVSAKNRKKHKKCKKNSDFFETFNGLGVISEKQKKKKSPTEANDECYDHETNSNNHHANKRKRKNLYDPQASAVADECEILPKKHKKNNKNSDNAEACAVSNKHDFISVNSLNENLLKNKEIDLNVTEGNNDYYKFEINSIDDHREKNQENNLNVSEAPTVINKTETVPKKRKKKKKHSNNTEAYFISNYSLKEDNLKGEKSDLNVAKINTIFDKPDLLEKYKKIQTTNENSLHASNFNIETGDELNNKMHTDSNQKHLMTDCDESVINHKKHKKKHKKSKDCVESAINHHKHKKDNDYLNYVSNNDVTSLELNTQCANNTVDVYLNSAAVDSAFGDGDINLSSKHCKKSKSKKKDKKNRENNLNKADVNENFHNLKQSFTDDTGNCIPINISDILLNKEIFCSPVNLHSIENESNYADNDTDANVHSLSNSVHKHKQKNKCQHLEMAALNTSGFKDVSDYYFDHQINNKTSDITDYTDEHLQSITDKGTQHSAKFRNFAPYEGIGTTYFSSDVDCSEDPVDFEVPPLHKFETVYRLTEVQKNDLEKSGVFIKTGKFTAAEDKIIQRNFEDFIKKFGVSDTFSVFGIGRYGKDTELLKFLKAKHFYVRLAKDLNDRSLHSVYKRARKILHPFENLGKLTEKEVDHLKRLHVTLSKKWQQIGDTLGSTAERCAETYRWHKKDIAKGKFTEEEEAQLIEALKTVSGSSDISFKNMKGVNWDAVALHVPSRNSSQCRMYWANNLAWASGSAKKKWNNQCASKLVHILKELNVDNSSKIDWRKVYESFEDFAPSDLFVQKRWLYLRSQIPDYKNKSFRKIIELLCNKYPLS